MENKYCHRCGQRIYEAPPGLFNKALGSLTGKKGMKAFEFKENNEVVFYCEQCANIKVQEERKKK